MHIKASQVSQMNLFKTRLFLCAFSFILCLPVLGNAQNLDGLSAYKVAGNSIAAAYGNWQITVTTPVTEINTPVQIHTESSYFTLSSGPTFSPFRVGRSLDVIDPSGYDETVVPSAVDCHSSPPGCLLTAVFSHAHNGRFLLSSATDGLQEAIDDLAGSGGIVRVTPAWHGTIAMILNASLPSNVLLRDERSGTYTWYAWNGSTVVSILHLASPVNNVSSGTSSRATAVATTGLNATSFGVQNLDGVRFADQYSGNDLCAQVNTAIQDTQPGGTVFIGPNGDAVCSEPIILDRSVSLQFSGPNSRLIPAPGFTGPMLIAQPNASGSNYPNVTGGYKNFQNFPIGYRVENLWIESPPDGGAVSTNGTTVTWVSGSPFQQSWEPGALINIAGTLYRIASIQSTTQLTLQSSAGIQANAWYLMDRPRPGADGVFVYGIDNFQLDGFTARDLDGYALKLSDPTHPVRESNFRNLWFYRDGDAATTTPTIWIPGTSINIDSNNNLWFSNVTAVDNFYSAIVSTPPSSGVNFNAEIYFHNLHVENDDTLVSPVDVTYPNADIIDVSGNDWFFEDGGVNGVSGYSAGTASGYACVRIGSLHDPVASQGIRFQNFVVGNAPDHTGGGSGLVFESAANTFLDNVTFGYAPGGSLVIGSLPPSSTAITSSALNGNVYNQGIYWAYGTSEAGASPSGATNLLSHQNVGALSTSAFFADVENGCSYIHDPSDLKDLWATLCPTTAGSNPGSIFFQNGQDTPTTAAAYFYRPLLSGQNSATLGTAASPWPSLYASQVVLAGQSMSSVPTMIWTAFAPSLAISGQVLSTWTPDAPVVIKRMEAQSATLPSSCATNAVVSLSGNGQSASLTVSGAGNETGNLNIPVPASSAITVSIQTAASCATPPQNVNIVVHYTMQ